MSFISQDDKEMARWQWRIFTGVWITYFSFYFCRANLGVAAKTLQNDLSLSDVQYGLLAACLKPAYGIGQFINGQLADRVGARKMLGIGMFTSAGLNFAFGSSSVLWLLILLWTTNGYFQAMGWPSCVKVMANWFPVHARGKAMGFIGTSYQFGNAATFWVVGWLVEDYGWRAGFWGPALYFAVIAVLVNLMVRTKPEDAGLASIHDDEIAAVNQETPIETLSFKETTMGVLCNRNLWIVALAFAGLDIIRYGFLDWAPKHLAEITGSGVSKSAIKASILPLGGAVGAVFAGWMTDRFFQSRRAPVVCVMLALLGVSTLFYHRVAQSGNTTMLMILLAVIGFFTYGPHVLMVGACPQDFGSRRMAASAAGFIDCMGYMGAMGAGLGTGYILQYFGGWDNAIYFWSGSAFFAAILMGFLWNTAVGKH
jgi:MFS transporter, OPA family, glycerol-3-phosphate transporter